MESKNHSLLLKQLKSFAIVIGVKQDNHPSPRLWVTSKKANIMYILALNCGSSSLKYQVFDADTKTAIVVGNVEKIVLADSFVTHKYSDGHKDK